MCCEFCINTSHVLLFGNFLFQLFCFLWFELLLMMSAFCLQSCFDTSPTLIFNFFNKKTLLDEELLETVSHDETVSPTGYPDLRPEGEQKNGRETAASPPLRRTPRTPKKEIPPPAPQTKLKPGFNPSYVSNLDV